MLTLTAPKLSRDDEVELHAKYKAHDVAARDQLVAFCWPVVLRIAHGRGSRNRDDLVQAGAVGVMRGLDRFDPSRGVSLRHYVAEWVRKEVREHIARNRGQVYLARPDREAGVDAAEADFDELAADMPDPEELLAARQLADLVGRLPDARARHVLLARLDGLTLEQAASELGVSRQRAWQLEQGALTTLRKFLGVSPTSYTPRDAGGRPAASPTRHLAARRLVPSSLAASRPLRAA